ncbi:MAG: homocysteine S-methyltransferase family protein [Phycisphaerales bacterium]|nr:homocysteine S-methyltransferase family protein [Phycisphaerales bacterium]
MHNIPITILDGPVGTELIRRGVDCTGPLWSARAIDGAPEVLGAIHREYAAAGATVHTAATFRTQPGIEPGEWARLARRGVELVREAVPRGHRVAGSLAPLADCYRPDLSPARVDPAATREAHLALARVLADAGCDILLCETFTDPGEGLLAAGAAVEAAEATGAEVWLSPLTGALRDAAQSGRGAQGGRAGGPGGGGRRARQLRSRGGDAGIRPSPGVGGVGPRRGSGGLRQCWGRGRPSGRGERGE